MRTRWEVSQGSTALAKDIARHPYAWPGGYVRAAVTSDGGLLCPKCVKAEFYQIAWSCRNEVDDGWRVVGSFHAGKVDDHHMTCDHCNAEMVTW